VSATMEIRQEVLSGLRSWAAGNDSVGELWLSERRATSEPTSENDIDLAISFISVRGDHQWAEGNYHACHDDWKRQLEAIAGLQVNLEAIYPDTTGEREMRRSGMRVWTRR
jgi:hypothetical protein